MKLQIGEECLAYLQGRNVAVVTAPTPEATRIYNSLAAKSGSNVLFYCSSTC